MVLHEIGPNEVFEAFIRKFGEGSPEVFTEAVKRVDNEFMDNEDIFTEERFARLVEEFAVNAEVSETRKEAYSWNSASQIADQVRFLYTL